jgi:cytochrome c oxidase subunit 2
MWFKNRISLEGNNVVRRNPCIKNLPSINNNAERNRKSCAEPAARNPFAQLQSPGVSAGRLLFGAVGLGNVDIDPDRALVNKFAAEHAGDRDQESAEQREIKSPRPDQRVRIVDAKQPIERCEGEQHHREGGVAPGSDQTANARHCNQVDQTDGAGNPAAQCTHAGKPETGARPEIIITQQISAIGCDQTDQCSNGKMDQHGVDRMATDRHFTHDGFGHRVHLSVVVLLTLLLAGCSGPLSSLDPAGPSARSGALLWWGMFSYASIVLIAVVALWLQAMRRPADTGDEAHQRRISNRWIIGGGLILPSVSITLLLIFGIPMGHRMLPLPPADGPALRIDVNGHQWWWEVRYPDSAISLTNELHIPAGKPIDIHLTSADVIHGFWVPRLGGKLDAIPGRTNVLRLQADEPGTYMGQCAEFCGLNHAVMKFTVTAHTPEDFTRWLERGGQEAKSND